MKLNEVTNITIQTFKNRSGYQPKVLFIENPSIQDCVDLIRTNEYLFVVPIYTGSVYDVPDWSYVIEKYEDIVLDGIIRPFYCRDDNEVLSYVDILKGIIGVYCVYLYKNMKLFGEINA
ncbi:hypothetical protein AB9_154 [Acinetobacter phage vB_AbaM_B9]|nr:hypothetical protein AB9_154 [Acinetobacter phage vB_AbaM_B9]